MQILFAKMMKNMQSFIFIDFYKAQTLINEHTALSRNDSLNK